jgi:hypothetical protein
MMTTNLLGSSKSDMLQAFATENLEYQKRLTQIANGGNVLTQEAFEPPVLITRHLSSNPFIHSLVFDVEEEFSPIEVLETSNSEEVQTFYDESDDQTKKLTEAMQKFLAKKFALEMAVPDIADFMAQALPEDVAYLEDIELLIPKLQKSLTQQLYLDIVLEVFKCSELTLDPAFKSTETSPKSNESSDIVQRFLDQWGKRNEQ